MRKKNWQAEDFDKALSYSYLLLKYRLRSEKEIFVRLTQKGYSPKVTKKVVKNLKERNYINDVFFAQEFTVYGLEKGWGKKKIEFQLQRLGVSCEISGRFLAEADYRERIKILVAAKRRKNIDNKDRTAVGRERARLARMLAGRGFEYSDICQVLNCDEDIS